MRSRRMLSRDGSNVKKYEARDSQSIAPLTAIIGTPRGGTKPAAEGPEATMITRSPPRGFYGKACKFSSPGTVDYVDMR